MNRAFAQPLALLLLLLAPAAIAILRYGDRRRLAALHRFAPRIAAGARGRRNRILLPAAIVALALALARPEWITAGAPTTPKRSGDVVFLLDVSRSMLSTDVAPNRLEHARGIIASLAAQLQGERVALVTFAGNSAIQSPLTVDYAYFRERLRTASMDSVTRGGTRLGDAITFATQTAFDDVERGSKVLVLLTDGGDQESSPETAAATASMRGIRLIAIGIGDRRNGAFVPTSESDNAPLLYGGQPVLTKLDADALRAIAAANLGGMYLESALDPPSVYRQLLAARKRTSAGMGINSVDLYPLLLAIAIVLLAVDLSMAERKAAVAIWLALVLTQSCWSWQEPSAPQKTTSTPESGVKPAGRGDLPFDLNDWMTAGDEAFRLRNYTEAARSYAIASDSAPRVPEVLYDLAVSLYRMRLYDEASTDFGKAEEASRDPHFRALCKLGQANSAYRMVRGADAMRTAQALQQVLARYREARALDPSLADVAHNIEVVKVRLESLKDQLRAASNRYMVQSPADVARSHHTDADDILREGAAGGAPRPPTKRSVDRDW